MCKLTVVADLEVLAACIEEHIVSEKPPTFVSYEGGCGGRGYSRRGFVGVSRRMSKLLNISELENTHASPIHICSGAIHVAALVVAFVLPA
jgi:hypothetical protein